MRGRDDEDPKDKEESGEDLDTRGRRVRRETLTKGAPIALRKLLPELKAELSDVQNFAQKYPHNTTDAKDINANMVYYANNVINDLLATLNKCIAENRTLEKADLDTINDILNVRKTRLKENSDSIAATQALNNWLKTAENRGRFLSPHAQAQLKEADAAHKKAAEIEAAEKAAEEIAATLAEEKAKHKAVEIEAARIAAEKAAAEEAARENAQEESSWDFNDNEDAEEESEEDSAEERNKKPIQPAETGNEAGVDESSEWEYARRRPPAPPAGDRNEGNAEQVDSHADVWDERIPPPIPDEVSSTDEWDNRPVPPIPADSAPSLAELVAKKDGFQTDYDQTYRLFHDVATRCIGYYEAIRKVRLPENATAAEKAEQQRLKQEYLRQARAFENEALKTHLPLLKRQGEQLTAVWEQLSTAAENLHTTATAQLRNAETARDTAPADQRAAAEAAVGAAQNTLRESAQELQTTKDNIVQHQHSILDTYTHVSDIRIAAYQYAANNLTTAATNEQVAERRAQEDNSDANSLAKREAISAHEAAKTQFVTSRREAYGAKRDNARQQIEYDKARVAAARSSTNPAQIQITEAEEHLNFAEKYHDECQIAVTHNNKEEVLEKLEVASSVAEQKHNAANREQLPKAREEYKKARQEFFQAKIDYDQVGVQRAQAVIETAKATVLSATVTQAAKTIAENDAKQRLVTARLQLRHSEREYVVDGVNNHDAFFKQIRSNIGSYVEHVNRLNVGVDYADTSEKGRAHLGKHLENCQNLKRQLLYFLHRLELHQTGQAKLPVSMDEKTIKAHIANTIHGLDVLDALIKKAGTILATPLTQVAYYSDNSGVIPYKTDATILEADITREIARLKGAPANGPELPMGVMSSKPTRTTNTFEVRVNYTDYHGVDVVSVQRIEANTRKCTSELRAGGDISSFSEKDYRRMAITEVENFLAVHSGTIFLKNKMPPKLVEAILIYCAHKGYGCVNTPSTGHHFVVKDRHVSALAKELNKYPEQYLNYTPDNAIPAPNSTGKIDQHTNKVRQAVMGSKQIQKLEEKTQPAEPAPRPRR